MSVHVPLRRSTALFSVDLHPALSSDPLRGVEEHLSTLVLRWSDAFEGVVLAYSRPRVSRRPAPIGPYFPYARVRAEAELALFAPRVGQLLRCTVHEVGPDFVAALALGFVNVSIEAARVRPEFRPPQRGPGGAWVSRADPARRLEPGVEALVRVVELGRQGAFLHVVASLEGEDTGRLDDLGVKEEEVKKEKKTKEEDEAKKNKGEKAKEEERKAKEEGKSAGKAKEEGKSAGKARASESEKKKASKHAAGSAAKEEPPVEASAPSKKASNKSATGAAKREAEASPAEQPATGVKKEKERSDKKDAAKHGAKRSRDASKADDGKEAEKKSKKKKKSSSK